MLEPLELVLDYVGGSLLAAGLVVAGVWVGRKLFERGLDSAIQQGIDAHRNALAKDLEDYKADIAGQLAEQQRVHEAKLEALRSELRAVESEAADLRAHSLGLEAERRRSFEAKRAEACAELFSSAVTALDMLSGTEALVRVAYSGLAVEGVEELRGTTRKQLGPAKRALNQLYRLAQTTALFTSDESYTHAGTLVTALRERYKQQLSHTLGDPWEDDGVRSSARSLSNLKDSLRRDMLSSAPGPTSPESAPPSSDASDDLAEGTPPTAEPQQSRSGSSPSAEAVGPE